MLSPERSQTANRSGPHTTRCAPWITVLLSVAIVAGSSRQAAARSYTRTELAKKHYADAEQHYRAAEFATALRSYQLAHTYRPLPAFLFNIAQCYRELDRYERAIFYYKLYLHHAPKATNREVVVAMITRLQKKWKVRQALLREQQRATLRIASQPAGARVYLDSTRGPPLGVTPLTTRVKPGRHMVTVRLAGHDDLQRLVVVKPGRELQVDAVLVKKGAVAPPPNRRLTGGPKPQASRLTAPYRRGWAIAGYTLTAALGIAAVLTGALTLIKADSYSEMYATDEGAAEFKRETIRLRTATDVLIGGAVLSALVTTTALIIAMRRWKRERRNRARLLFTPACTATGCVIGAVGRF